MKNKYTEQEIYDFMINVGYDTEAEALEAMSTSDEYESEKAALIPELIQYFDGDIKAAELAADEMAWGLVYG